MMKVEFALVDPNLDPPLWGRSLGVTTVSRFRKFIERNGVHHDFEAVNSAILYWQKLCCNSSPDWANNLKVDLTPETRRNGVSWRGLELDAVAGSGHSATIIYRCAMGAIAGLYAQYDLDFDSRHPPTNYVLVVLDYFIEVSNQSKITVTT